MTTHSNPKGEALVRLSKLDPSAPALVVLDETSIAIKEGTIFNGHTFAELTPVPIAPGALLIGADYVVVVGDGGACAIAPAIRETLDAHATLGGFHYAPGGNASGRAGGSIDPAINPHSLWDIGFGPACRDPRGMVLVDAPAGRFWCDVYLTGVNHAADGTSRFGVIIADGDDVPPGHKRFDYAAAMAVLAEHGKQLLSIEEFFAAAYGVTERTSASKDPKRTGLDAARTSKWGLMQATGNLWVWGHDGDPDEPRPSLFGGSWVSGDYAGSRQANVDYWAGNSGGDLGVRGRSDHLQLA